MNATATENTHGEAHQNGEAHEHEHGMSNAGYIKIAILLAVLTAVEVATYYVDFGPLFLPTLLILMAVKFFIVVSYFMHLKFDSKLFSFAFYSGLVLAVAVYVVFLSTFKFFTA